MKPRLTLLFIALLTSVMTRSEPTNISAQLEKILAGSGVPSLAAAAVVDGQIVSIGASGIRKHGDPTPVTLDDKYHIGSCTKSMTATLGAILIESGRLTWETTISEVFPHVALHEDYRKVTFRQLVTNTSGTPDDIEPGLWSRLFERKGTEREQRRQLVEAILTQPPAYAPGSKQVYSNAGFAIAGAMLETLMDQPYEQLLAERVLKPLGLQSAGFRAPATVGKVDQPQTGEI
jgi:CubicO group peptidase (beta-lactamase class C family)